MKHFFPVNVIWQVDMFIAVKLRPKSISHIQPMVNDASNNFRTCFFSCDVGWHLFPGSVLAVMKSMN